MSVGGEAAVPPRPCPLVIVWVMVRPIRHVRQAAGRYLTLTLVRCKFIDKPLKICLDSSKSRLFMCFTKGMTHI